MDIRVTHGGNNEASPCFLLQKRHAARLTPAGKKSSLREQRREVGHMHGHTCRDEEEHAYASAIWCATQMR